MPTDTASGVSDSDAAAWSAHRLAELHTRVEQAEAALGTMSDNAAQLLDRVETTLMRFRQAFRATVRQRSYYREQLQRERRQFRRLLFTVRQSLRRGVDDDAVQLERCVTY